MRLPASEFSCCLTIWCVAADTETAANMLLLKVPLVALFGHQQLWFDGCGLQALLMAREFKRQMRNQSAAAKEAECCASLSVVLPPETLGPFDDKVPTQCGGAVCSVPCAERSNSTFWKVPAISASICGSSVEASFEIADDFIQLGGDDLLSADAARDGATQR